MVSLKELTGPLLHARQRGRMTYTHDSWELKPVSGIDALRPVPDGYTPYTPVYKDQQFEGLRMIEIPASAFKPPKKFLCVYGCQREGSHFFLCNDQ